MTPFEAGVLHISSAEPLRRYSQLYSKSAALMKLDVFSFAPKLEAVTLLLALTCLQILRWGIIRLDESRFNATDQQQNKPFQKYL